ncbi:MAG: TonB family protein [Bacteroidetes bacterium]|nr:TonB family protein [Bacteroidota bacterium]
MKPELILKADMLDILFENRNKEYGAYQLRRQYDKRLYKSLGIIITLLFSFVILSLFKNYFFPTMNRYVPPSDTPPVELSLVDQSKPPVKPALKPVSPRRIAEIINTIPIITKREVVNPPPTQEELENKISSTRNVIGDDLKPNDAITTNTVPTGAGQETTKVETEETKILRTAEVMPQFPGGEPALQRFLIRNIRTPESSEPGAKLRVMMRFVVDKEGNVVNVEVEQSSGNDFDKEVMRVVKKMPQWKAGMQNGKNVSVYFNLPVVLEVPDEN